MNPFERSHLTAKEVGTATLQRTGALITMEGIDGAGKSSHLDAAAQWLRSCGLEVVVTREPGGSELAEQLRELVLAQDMDGLTEVLLVFAARRDHIRKVIGPALAAGKHVLCDRFTDATFAYQGCGRGFNWSHLQQLESWVQEGLHPALTLWFDLPAEVAATRRAAARSPDRFEAEETAFFERVREGYARRLAHSQGRMVRINALGSREEVWTQVERTLQTLVSHA